MSIDAIIDGIVDREGGYVNDPRDAGGETNFGITVRVARANGYTGKMKDLTRDKAEAIYRSEYVIRPGFAAVIGLSEKIAEELVDTGVNMGVAKASEFLQKSLNALNNQGKDYPDIAEDSDVGPGTIRALKAFLDKRGKDGELVLLRLLNGLQVARYVEIARMRGANEAFVFGWIRTRIS
jgi:lysozyme family protein